MARDGSGGSAVASVVALLRAGVDAVLGLDLAACSRDDLLELARGTETQRQRLPVADHRLIAELETRGVAGDLSYRSTGALLTHCLRLTPGQARARVAAAADLGPRRALSGEALPPVFPVLAAAQAAGVVSERHATVIRAAVNVLPAAVEAVHGPAVEATLTDHARDWSPDQVAILARRVVDLLNPDGRLADDTDHARRRGLELTPNRDGSGTVHGRLDPVCVALWQAVLDPLARPNPATDGAPDPRTAAQRRHDGFADATRRLLAAGGLPDTGGAAATVLITITAAQAATMTDTPTAAPTTPASSDDPTGPDEPAAPGGTGVPQNANNAASPGGADNGAGPAGGADNGAGPAGGAAGGAGGWGEPADGPVSGYATTGHGQLLSLTDVTRLADQAVVVPVLLSPTGGILDYGRTRRIATDAQRLALAARDGGCSFAGCDVPPAWCQSHHVVPWLAGGPTALHNLTLLCARHHRDFDRHGWTCQMIRDRPHWLPPTWLDPNQAPRQPHPPPTTPRPTRRLTLPARPR